MKKYIIYLITQNGVVRYVGMTSNFTQRKRRHLNERGTSYSAIPVDMDLNTIEVIPIEYYDNETDTLKREDELIREYQTIENGWNKNRSGLIETSDVKEYQKRWREEHKEEQKIYQHNYNQKPERKLKVKERSAKRNKTEQGKAYKHDWYLEHKEKLRDKNKQWRQENKDKVKEYRQKPEYKAWQREYQREYQRQRRLKKKQEKQCE